MTGCVLTIELVAQPSAVKDTAEFYFLLQVIPSPWAADVMVLASDMLL